MFGNGSGEKKQRINEMAAYYLARAAGCLFFLFTYSAPQRARYQKCVQGSYSRNPVCMHDIFHAQPWKHSIVSLGYILYSNVQSLVNDYLADWECFVLFLLPNTLNPPGVRRRHTVSPLFLPHTHRQTRDTDTHRMLQRNINWIPGLFTHCLSAGHGPGREWDSWFPWLCPINTSLSVLLEAGNKSHVFDRADNKATCLSGSRRGSVTQTDREAGEVELVTL